MENIFHLEKKYADKMIAHARAETPNECCGVLAGVNGRVIKLYCSTNAEHSPYRYSVDPNELLSIYQEIDKNGWDLLAIFHSHTHSEAFPSPVDVHSAFLPGSWYIIISLSDPDHPVMRVFRIVKGKITEGELKIQEIYI